MQDFFGNEILVGDHVAFSTSLPGINALTLGKVAKINAKTATIEYLTDEAKSSWRMTKNCKPNQIVRSPNQPKKKIEYTFPVRNYELTTDQKEVLVPLLREIEPIDNGGSLHVSDTVYEFRGKRFHWLSAIGGDEVELSVDSYIEVEP